ncbi:MAG: DUF4956 domain-containing protein [Bacteroidales bacterium]|nr:DUF4956 domain-containing protein [Bacteroidales bacterium]
METLNSILSIIPIMDINISELELFKIKLVDIEDFTELTIRFVFNLLVCLFLVRVLYYSITKRKDYLFTYVLFSTIVFLLCFLLENVKLELGFALGLFAIFGIIRYRTTTIPIKEMTYLFVVIGVSVINALANKKVSYAELLFTNLMIVFIVWGLERIWLLKNETSKTIVFEKIDLIKPENYQLLLEDLKERTGLQINRAEVGKVNFLRDTAEIKIYYFNGTQTLEDDEFFVNQDMV